MAGAPDIKDLLERAKAQKQLIEDSLKGLTAEERLLEKQDGKYKSKVRILKEINLQIQELTLE